jgi:hypothetical protein
MFLVDSRTVSIICAGLALMMKHLTELALGTVPPPSVLVDRKVQPIVAFEQRQTTIGDTGCVAGGL